MKAPGGEGSALFVVVEIESSLKKIKILFHILPFRVINDPKIPVIRVLN